MFKERSTIALLVCGLIIITGVAIISIWFFGIGDGSESVEPRAEISASYNHSNETVRLIHDGGDTIREERVEYIIVESKGKTDEDYNRVGLVINNRSSPDGIWLGDPEDKVTSVSSNDTAFVVSDGTDSDNDGIKGVEIGETIRVIYQPASQGWFDNDGYITLGKFEVTQSGIKPT